MHASKTQTNKDKAELPLVVDMIGPMAFRWSGSGLDVWMPQLGKSHEAGIVTPVMGFELPEGNYKISGTEGSADGHITPHLTNGSRIYQAGAPDPKKYYIHLSLPMPFNIVLLHPVRAKIWTNGSKPTGHAPYAVGLRLLYAHAGKPELSGLGETPLPPDAPDGVIRFDPDPAEVQLDMSITYSCHNACDPNDANNSFKALAELLHLNLNFELVEPTVTLHHPCKSPVVQLT